MFIQAGVLCKWTNDSQRLLLEHFDMVYNSPSQLYHSALPLSPSLSWLHKHYTAELLQVVRVAKGLPAEWGMCFRTVSLDSYARGLSYWNHTIAVGSRLGDITILNAITGSQTAVLSEHREEVNTLAFSPDGKLLVSGCYDKTVKLWDMQTGGVVKTFYGHTHWVLSVSISADCTRIASVSKDKTISLWDIHTGECHLVIIQQRIVSHVSFFPNTPQHLLSVCKKKVWKWDTNRHQIGPTYDSSYVTFSSDSTRFISCNEATITVRNSNSGVIVTEFHVVQGGVYRCCLSPDNRLVAVAVKSTAYVWDITHSDPHLIETFTGHAQNILCLTFSSPSSLITTSKDKSIKFWQIGIPKNIEADPESVKIRSVTLQTKDNIIITSDSDGVVKTWDISTSLCKASFQTPAKHFCKRDIQLINGRLILVWYGHKKIDVQDAEKGELLLEIDQHTSLADLKISGDGSRVFILSAKSIQASSIKTGEIMGKVEIMGSKSEYGTLTVDDSRVWVHFSHSGYQGWDFGALGSSPIQLPNTPPYKLHPNGVVFWETDPPRIRNRVTGKVVFQLPKGYGKPIDVQWNDQHLVACFSPTDVLILDFSHVLLQ